MSEFNLGQFLTKVVDYSLGGAKGAPSSPQNRPVPAHESFSKNLIPPPQRHIEKPMNPNLRPSYNVQANHLADLDKALYVKDLMNLPKDMKVLLEFIKKNMGTSNNAAPLLASSINLNEIALLLQQNGKEALSKLIMAMSNASKQGVEDLSSMKEMMKLINASVSVAEQNNPSSALKSLMLCYLPWLPAQDGVGFELEIESGGEESKSSDSSITVMVSTKNYGNVKAVLILSSSNNEVTALVTCSDSFPKEELLKKIKSEGVKHSLQSTVVVEQKASGKNSETSSPQAKLVTADNANVNPYLILMAHGVIKAVIEIDNGESIC